MTSKEDRVKIWLNQIFSNGALGKYSLTVDGESEQGDGYIGDILFVTASNSEENKKYNFVIKHGKSSSSLREAVPVRDAFINEITIYETVFPYFNKFQTEDVFNSYPKCFGTLVGESMEVIVLENLKKTGYELHDRLKPMDLDHIKLILGEYGKFHGLSLALKDQQPGEFLRLASEVKSDIFVRLIRNGILTTVKDMFKDSLTLVSGNKRMLLHLEKLLGEMDHIFGHVSNAMDAGMVITHGDCWNNNFVFKYDPTDHRPTKVAILDWQVARVNSPVHDLSYFIYGVASKEQLNHLDDLLRFYHETVSSTLIRLGSKPEAVFPFNLLMEHWERYSKFGISFSPAVLQFCLCPKELAPDMVAKLESGMEMRNVFQFDLGNVREMYNSRVRDVFEHASQREFI